ncbi:MAG: YbaB/EbfC family nucleoid-associated protein [Acidimicrobiales bacterium]|nr:YbaB/EbfC family nucleoid-associated protein [Acidimicrobiales bacterium]RZV45469.1 MAG: YbaB/EbfC family nucleoid-associated protein [Acidimicrobiales bacterium]
MPDLGGLMAQAQEMMASAQEAAAEIVEGSAGGGMVKVQVDGGFNFHSVTIDPTVVDSTDVDMLQDLVLAALRDAATQIQDGQADAMGGLDLGGLGGLLGGA